MSIASLLHAQVDRPMAQAGHSDASGTDALPLPEDTLMRDADERLAALLDDARPSTAAHRFQKYGAAVKEEAESTAASEAEDVMPPLEEFIEPAGDDDYAPKAKKKRSKARAPRRPRPSARAPQDSGSDTGGGGALTSHGVGAAMTDLDRFADIEAYFNNTAPREDAYGESVYCICRKDDMGKWMIGCDGCDEWYHGECIRISKTDEALIDQYFCPRCERNEVGHTTWKKKCRLVGCRRPVEAQEGEEGDPATSGTRSGKYCSHAHGLAYFKLRLGQALLTQAQVASLVKCSASRADFCRLGDRAPAVEGVAFTEKEQRRLEETRKERQEITDALAQTSTLHQAVTRMREKATRVNAGLKARKEKELCGLDLRLLLQETELATLLRDQRTAFEEQMRSTAVEEMCAVPAKKCVKHAGWYQIYSDAFAMEERLLKGRLDALRAEDESIRKAAQRRA